MKRIGAKYSITKVMLDGMIELKYDFESHLFSGLALSLSKEIINNASLPIPVSKNEIYTYITEVGLCSVQEMRQIHKDRRELELFRELASSAQVLVDRTLQEEEINELLGK